METLLITIGILIFILLVSICIITGLIFRLIDLKNTNNKLLNEVRRYRIGGDLVTPYVHHERIK